MKRKVEIKYIDKLWHKMQHALQRYIKTENVEDMHRFRVQVKKLRAFITLAESAENHFELKRTFKPVKKLFSKAGEIRTADLNIEIARSHSAKSSVIKDQIKQRDQAVKQFKPFAKKNLNKLKVVKQRFQKKLKPISNVHINVFYLETLKQLGENLSNIRFDESLHDARKQLKVLLYDHQLAAPVLNLNFNKDYVDQVQETIGDWHDNDDAKALFQQQGLPLTGLNQNELKLQARIKQVVKEMYNKATNVTDVPLPQLS